MRALVLGAAAGGGVPQWNCSCENCRLAFAGDPRVAWRTQSSVAVSCDDRAWLLLNASPDLRQQVLATPALHPRGELRHSPIAAVFLTNGDVDHVAGLLSLRERQPFTLHASRATLAALASPIFDALAHDVVCRREHALGTVAEILPGLHVTPFAVPGKTPLYLETEHVPVGVEGGETIGLEIAASGRRMIYVPACAAITRSLLDRIEGADLLLFDGTTWTDDEMPRLGVSTKTAHRMGHVAMSGPHGAIAMLASAQVARRVFTHLNNTNPVLREDSVERAQTREAGWEIASDGMEFVL